MSPFVRVTSRLNACTCEKRILNHEPSPPPAAPQCRLLKFLFSQRFVFDAEMQGKVNKLGHDACWWCVRVCASVGVSNGVKRPNDDDAKVHLDCDVTSSQLTNGDGGGGGCKHNNK